MSDFLYIRVDKTLLAVPRSQVYLYVRPGTDGTYTLSACLLNDYKPWHLLEGVTLEFASRLLYAILAVDDGGYDIARFGYGSYNDPSKKEPDF
jgi:hypothetical protein